MEFFYAIRTGEGTSQIGKMFTGGGSHIKRESDLIFVLNILGSELKKCIAAGDIDLPSIKKKKNPMSEHTGKKKKKDAERTGNEDIGVTNEMIGEETPGQRFGRAIILFNRYIDSLKKVNLENKI